MSTSFPVRLLGAQNRTAASFRLKREEGREFHEYFEDLFDLADMMKGTDVSKMKMGTAKEWGKRLALGLDALKETLKQVVRETEARGLPLHPGGGGGGMSSKATAPPIRRERSMSTVSVSWNLRTREKDESILASSSGPSKLVRELTPTLAINASVYLITEALTHEMRARRGLCYAYVRVRDELQALAVAGSESIRTSFSKMVIPANVGTLGSVLNSGVALNVDQFTDNDEDTETSDVSPAACACFPIWSSAGTRTVIGLIELRRMNEPFSENDMAIMNVYSNQLSYIMGHYPINIIDEYFNPHGLHNMVPFRENVRRGSTIPMEMQVDGRQLLYHVPMGGSYLLKEELTAGAVPMSGKAPHSYGLQDCYAEVMELERAWKRIVEEQVALKSEFEKKSKDLMYAQMEADNIRKSIQSLHAVCSDHCLECHAFVPKFYEWKEDHGGTIIDAEEEERRRKPRAAAFIEDRVGESIIALLGHVRVRATIMDMIEKDPPAAQRYQQMRSLFYSSLDVDLLKGAMAFTLDTFNRLWKSRAYTSLVLRSAASRIAYENLAKVRQTVNGDDAMSYALLVSVKKFMQRKQRQYTNVMRGRQEVEATREAIRKAFGCYSSVSHPEALAVLDSLSPTTTLGQVIAQMRQITNPATATIPKTPSDMSVVLALERNSKIPKPLSPSDDGQNGIPSAFSATQQSTSSAGVKLPAITKTKPKERRPVDPTKQMNFFTLDLSTGSLNKSSRRKPTSATKYHPTLELPELSAKLATLKPIK